MRLAHSRFTIRALMAVIATAAILFWLFRRAGSLPFLVALGGLALAFISWACVRGRPRAAAIGFIVAIVAANACVAPICIYCDGSWWIGVYAGLFGAIPMALGFATAWALARTTGRRSVIYVLRLLSLALVVTPFVTLWTFWPLHVAFLVSRPALERLADRVAAGHAPAFPVSAGVYRIVGCALDYHTGNIALVTDSNPAGRSGFVRSEPGTSHGPFSSLFMGIKLNRRWSFELED
jgi:hypothetical protein